MGISVGKIKRNGSTYLRLSRGKRRAEMRIDKIKRGQRVKFETIANELDTNLGVGIAHSAELLLRVGGLDNRWQAMLKKVGLLTQHSSVLDFLDQCIDSNEKNVGLKFEAPHANKVNKHLERFKQFLKSKKIEKWSELTVAVAEDWRDVCLEQRAKATIAKELGYLRSHVNEAVKRQLLGFNPFADITISVPQDELRSRRYQISPSEFATLESWYEDHREDSLERQGYCIWFHICRWTGCRKNEALLLKWSDVDFEKGRIEMPSPKTARNGVAKRPMPLYQELREPLLRENASRVSEYVVNGVLNLPRSTRREEQIKANNKNGGPTLIKHIKEAGLSPWPKPFQNIRASRENELRSSGEYRPEAIDRFIGHDHSVYMKHYSNLLDSDFRPNADASPRLTSSLTSEIPQDLGATS